jgi:transcriptional regulator with GAF, ATPase, and Fis domain
MATPVTPDHARREPDRTARQLLALRQLLRRDVLSHADWEGALVDAARMARQALEADAGMLALWEEATGWSAWTHEGHHLGDGEIRLVASRSVLEQVRTGGQPLVSRERLPALGRSASAIRHGLGYVLAIPLRWWEPGEDHPAARFAGCLYVDRRGVPEAFAEEDVELLRDLAATVERTLGLLRHVAQLAGSADAWREHATALERQRSEARHAESMASRDAAFRKEVLEPLERAARTDRVGILLLGPTGSGKTHLAYTFHAASRRRGGPFVVLDCGQVTSSEALAAELFGYGRRSGFAAPPEGRPGKARLASGGTLFLDEIGSLPLELQQRLLRLVQFGRFAPLGEAEEQLVDLQIVAAANEDLAALVRSGRFREDLYWRLAEMVVRVPPLDAHPSDIPGLAESFLARARERFGRGEIAGFTSAALAALVDYPWSQAGNIRGLEHTVHRSVLLAPTGVRRLDAEALSFVVPLGARVVPSAALRAGAPEAAAAPAGAAAGRGRHRSLPAAGARGEERGREARAPGEPEELGLLLAEALSRHRGNLAAVAVDPEVVSALAPGLPTVPPSTLRLRIRQLGLEAAVRESRSGPSFDAICQALREHGEAALAASALGLTRDQLVWQLRRRGLSIRAVLAGAGEGGSPSPATAGEDPADHP